ncbi:hypothetical protein [Corallococcus sp. AS-1-6]|uniref:hypothetical protein n=1 Tax=Corallococcus sp. AS-1-6 TaxID=2874599 RepID=UPI001CC01C02|nr:hypothetical protein [Corallococcus sp. AS-1-6]MBZ4373279.1 hypothetical protein [Corallococcus sp. AS-1-6]
MALKDLTDSDAVLKAIAEFDALGREAFLRAYGFGEARSYFLVHNGKKYDSKAIVGVAHGYQYPPQGPLWSSEFSGGFVTVLTQLKALGFTVQHGSDPLPHSKSKPAPPPTFPVGGEVRNAAQPPLKRRPRPFDSSRPPADFIPGTSHASPEDTLALREKATHGHYALLVELHRSLEAAGWTDIEEIPAAVDLWARSPNEGRRVIFEAKTLAEGNELHQTRSALAQLLEYRHVHGAPEDELCVVVDRPLSIMRERILLALNVIVLWHDGSIFRSAEGAPRGWVMTLASG